MVRFTPYNMGGGPRYRVPKYVWSPIGGWWPEPKNWARNTALYIGFMGFAASVIITTSWANERRPIPPRVKSLIFKSYICIYYKSYIYIYIY